MDSSPKGCPFDAFGIHDNPWTGSLLKKDGTGLFFENQRYDRYLSANECIIIEHPSQIHYTQRYSNPWAYKAYFMPFHSKIIWINLPKLKVERVFLVSGQVLNVVVAKNILYLRKWENGMVFQQRKFLILMRSNSLRFCLQKNLHPCKKAFEKVCEIPFNTPFACGRAVWLIKKTFYASCKR